MAGTRTRSSAFWNRLVVGALLVLLAVVLIRTAWVGDDAYLTLRAVDNLIHGYGPTWNVAERVQTFTHPLWMLVLAVAYFITREAYFTTIALCIAISLLSLFVLMTFLARTPLAAATGGLSLIFSKAFVDYATSGLENALTNLLLALFFVIDLRVVTPRRRLFALSILAALIALNRFDAVVLVLPSFLFALYGLWPWLRRNSWQAIGVTALGFTPLLAWEVFSLIYYGFLVPNTAFAKLSTGIPIPELLKQGLLYLFHSTYIDFFTSLCLVVGGVVVLWKGNTRGRMIIAGAIAYLVYIIWIGGDFMSGRFLAAPLFCVVAAVVSLEWLWAAGRHRIIMIALPSLVLLGVIAPYSLIRGDRFFPCVSNSGLPTGVADERGCFFPGTALIRQRPGRATTPDQDLFRDGLHMREQPRALYLRGAVGMLGYAAGPEVHIVDLNALADPLLARLPMPKGKPWRIGHFERLIPAGYLETLATGENKLCNPGIAAFYDKLRTITHGPLFTRERLEAIWKMNTGQYDGLLKNYGNPDALSTQLCNADTSTEVQFIGGPKLVGYSVGTYQPKPGSVLPVTLYWQRGDDHTTPLASFVHVRPSMAGQAANPRSESGMWAQAEHFEPGGRQTIEWWPGEVYTDQFLLDIPVDMPAGPYNFEVGWFNSQAGEQLEPKPETVKPPHSILWRSILLPPLIIQ